MRDKKGVMIIIESKKGNKFGAFFATSINFTHDTIESHEDEHLVLFNITKEKKFRIKNKKIKSLHTSTRLGGLHPKIYFGQEIPIVKNKE